MADWVTQRCWGLVVLEVQQAEPLVEQELVADRLARTLHELHLEEDGIAAGDVALGLSILVQDSDCTA